MATLGVDHALRTPLIMSSFEDDEIRTGTRGASRSFSSSGAGLKVQDEIEKSKPHWSEHRDLCEEASGAYKEACEEHTLCSPRCLGDLFASFMNMVRKIFVDWERNRQTTKLLLDHNIRLGNPGKDLVLGDLIAEGSQAVIYEAEWAKRNGERDGTSCTLVFKVFKTSFDLRRDCPLPMLRRGNQGHFTVMCHGATLLRDGRLAFVYDRYWGSLEKLIGERREHNKDGQAFSLLDTIRIMLEIARGMRNLHMKGLIHRDLKSANILVDCDDGCDIVKDRNPKFACNITDYESSKQVVGTRFWRAPEVLRYISAVREGYDVDPESAFSEKSDVYSYAMTCYEVITGCVPLKGTSPADYDAVLKHELRPALPEHLPPWITELITQCWHSEASQRPAFLEIEDKFIANGIAI